MFGADENKLVSMKSFHLILSLLDYNSYGKSITISRYVMYFVINLSVAWFKKVQCVYYW